MFNQLTVIGYGVVVFAIVVGVGVTVLSGFSKATASCPTLYPTYNETSGSCYNGSSTHVDASESAQNVYYMMGQMGQSGLAGWTPAVIAIVIGLLFLGAFMVNKGGKGRY